MSDLVPQAVNDEEVLGRGIFDSSKAADAIRGKIHPKVFREKAGVKEISTDRVEIADRAALILNHEAHRSGQSFKGWATIYCAEARSEGRAVEGNEVPGNPWHADIILPLSGGLDDADEQKAHALSLATRAKWLSRP